MSSEPTLDQIKANLLEVRDNVNFNIGSPAAIDHLLISIVAVIDAINGRSVEGGSQDMLITPHMLNAGVAQITSPTMDADDSKDLAVRIFRAMIAARNSAPTGGRMDE